MKATLFALNALSAACALTAAYYWWRVGREKTPEWMGLTADQTNFDWLTIPLANQGKFNTRAAVFACLAALFQAAAILFNLPATFN
jgi:hypothetical protein